MRPWGKGGGLEQGEGKSQDGSTMSTSRKANLIYPLQLLSNFA